MDNTNELENQRHPDPGSPSLEDEVRALERRIAEHQDQLRDYEKSLVERIADVDDDRRTTASKLRRAWQTQREEINDHLRRQTAIVAGTLVLFVIVLGAVLFLAYRQMDLGPQALADDVAELKQEVRGISGKPEDRDLVRDELNRLSTAVNEISSSLGRHDEKQADSLDTILEDERIARDEADALIGAEIQRLEARQRNLAQEFESLRGALTTARTTEPMPSTSRGSPKRSAEPGPAKEPAAATVAPPLELNSTPPTMRESSPPDETSVAAAERPVGDAGHAAPDEDPNTDTPEAVVVSNRTYALQLVGYYNRNDLLRFADRDDLPERLYYREEIVRGRPWFALIHSMHKDYTSASAELNQLTPELVAMDPWIRPIRKGVELKVLDNSAGRRP